MLDNDTIIEYIRGAAAEVFTTMLGTEIEAGPASIEQASPRVTDGVLSLVGLAGPWAGAGIIACNAAFACRACNLFLMTEATAVTDEVLDAIGELTNMIIGNFKTKAEEKLGPLGLSIPTVIFGRNFTSRSLSRNEWIVMPFRCGDDTFEIRVCFAPNQDRTSPHAHRHAGSVSV